MSTLTNKQLKDRLQHLQIDLSQHSFRTQASITTEALTEYLLKLMFLTQELSQRII